MFARTDAHLGTDNSPWTQVAILGFVTFCSVGMFSAISGLGAGYVEQKRSPSPPPFFSPQDGDQTMAWSSSTRSYRIVWNEGTDNWLFPPFSSGTQDVQLSDTANAVLYGTFAVGGFFAGSVHVSSFFFLFFWVPIPP